MFNFYDLLSVDATTSSHNFVRKIEWFFIFNKRSAGAIALTRLSRGVHSARWCKADDDIWAMLLVKCASSKCVPFNTMISNEENCFDSIAASVQRNTIAPSPLIERWDNFSAARDHKVQLIQIIRNCSI